MDTLLFYIIFIPVFWFGFDVIVKRTCGPRIHQSYRQVTRWMLRAVWRQLSRLTVFIWTRYHQFVLGAVSMFFFLLLTGRLVV